MLRQKTLKKKVSLKGIGIHSGKEAEITFKPAPEDLGIKIVRKFNFKDVIIDVTPENVINTQNQVTLGTGKYFIRTIEHVLSALSGLGITNCIIELNSSEAPIMDGSAYPFIEAIESVGIKYQNTVREKLIIPHPIWITDRDKYLVILPSDKLKINFHIAFDHPLLKAQSVFFDITRDTYIKKISKARTFGFYEELEKLKNNGLAKGGSFQNAIVYSSDGIMNNKLRYENECVRHKVLDLIGDFSLLGLPVKGHVIANKSGHTLDVALVKRIKELIINNRFTKADIKENTKKFNKIEKDIMDNKFNIS